MGLKVTVSQDPHVHEYKQFINYFNKDGNEKTLWICKPSDLSRGRGITIIDNMDDL